MLDKSMLYDIKYLYRVIWCNQGIFLQIVIHELVKNIIYIKSFFLLISSKLNKKDNILVYGVT